MDYISTHKLKSFLVLVFCFCVFVALSKSQPEQVIFVPYTGDTDSFIKTLEERGIISNQFSKLFIQAIIALRGTIEPGGYEFSSMMGAVSTVLTLNEPQYRYVSIYDGFRKGEIADRLGQQLDWDKEKVQAFAEVPALCPLEGQEGYLASGRYLIHVKENEEIVEQTMMRTFQEVLRELNIKEENVSIPQIIVIASLIQREAAGTEDMRLISGIIQNRLTINMPLQIDATLQYVKGTSKNWWPVPKSEDKHLDSPFNTYKNKGLPPLPIATPSKDAIYAALNPLETDCLYYIHDSRRVIHCAKDYDQHKRNIRNYLR
jgi:UPF0755 protein